MHIHARVAARTAATALLFVPSALAQDLQVVGPVGPAPPAGARAAVGPVTSALLTNVPGSPSAAVPGLGGVAFQPGTGTGHFDRVYGHPGGHWVLTALADLPSGEDECLIRSGALVIREGTPAPWIGGGAEDCGTIDQRCGVDAAGGVVFATNSSGSVDDDWIVTHRQGVWGHAAREGEPVPGLPGATLDDALDSCFLLDDGRVGYAADGVDGVASADEDDLIVLGAQVLLREGVSVPDGQAGAPEAVENFDLSDFWAAADGSRWLVQGDLLGPTASDDVVIVDGRVVVQEGVPLPGAGYTDPVGSGGAFGVSMDAAGAWFARGDNLGGHDWVLRDGVVIAETGAPVAAGSTELWDDATFADGFFAQGGNGYGSYVVGGTTDHPEVGLDAVLVLDGERVIARESDPVDMDGDGLLDDGVFIDTFGDDDLTLTADLRVLVVVTLKDAAGVRLGQGLVVVDARGGLGEPHCAGALNSAGRHASLGAVGSLGATANGFGLVLAGGPAGESAVVMVGRSRGLLPGFGGSAGDLCISGTLGVRRGPGQVLRLDGGGACRFDVDLNALPLGTGVFAAQSGETWQFQGWHRDLDLMGGPTSNTSNAVEVVFR